MNLLISIKPEFVEKILSGEKKYEFRRTIFRQKVDKVYIYSTSPDKLIVGYFDFEEVIEDTPSNLWDKFNGCGGISKESFFEYYEGKEIGYAIKIGKLHVFSKPIDVSTLKDFRAPQSFCYIEDIEN